MESAADIVFPNIGITINSLPKGFEIFGFNIAFYGCAIAFGILCGLLLTQWQAKRTNQDPDMYMEFALFAVIFSIVGARIYYVIFEWDSYKDNLLQIFNLRAGGIAIYGCIIGGVITCIVYAKIKKLNMFLMVDTAAAGLVIGQIIGRWGNFFNREAFGDYTNNIFAMQIKLSQANSSMVNQNQLSHMITQNGAQYIQVHPTFLYESLWNVAVLALILWYTKRKKYDGELFLLYIICYAAGRVWIEGLRTDQLQFWGTNIAVSQVLSGVIIVAGVAFMIMKRIRMRKTKPEEINENE